MTDAPDPRSGLTVTHRRYVPYSHAHYAGDLVDGAYVLGLFGDVATEVCIRTDGDEGLFASYSDVQFRAPVQAGDVVEVDARVTRVGTRSRELTFEARVVCRGVAADEPADGRVGGRRPRPAARRGHCRRHRGGPSADLSDPIRQRSMAHSGDVGTRVRADTPKPLPAKGKSLLPASSLLPAALRICAGHRAVDRDLSEHQGERRPPQDTRKESPSATHTWRLRARDGAMRKRRPGARSDRRRRLGWGGDPGGETREGPDRPVDNGLRSGSRPDEVGPKGGPGPDPSPGRAAVRPPRPGPRPSAPPRPPGRCTVAARPRVSSGARGPTPGKEPHPR